MEKESLIEFLTWFINNESEYDIVTIEQYVDRYLSIKLPNNEASRVSENEQYGNVCIHPTCIYPKYKDELCKHHYNRIKNKQT